jgi:hypothetical protein
VLLAPVLERLQELRLEPLQERLLVQLLELPQVRRLEQLEGWSLSTQQAQNSLQARA